MNRVVIFLLIITWVLQAMSQDLQISNIEFRDNRVVVTYEVEDSVVGRFYTVRMYSSRDNYLNPLEKVSGEIGLEIKPGGERQAVWDASAELGEDFSGDVSLELRARVYIPFIHTDWFEDVRVLRRKHEYHVTWNGGRDKNIMNFDLYKGKQKVATFANIANVGHYKLNLPGHIKPGKNYRFRISDIKNKDEVVYTPVFKIKRRFPFFLTHVLPTLMAGGGLYYLSQLSMDDSDIPDPIVPDSN